MNASQQIGVVILGVAVFLFVWSFNRFTNIIGQLVSWKPPFQAYQTLTIVAGLGAFVLLLVGLRMVFPKSKNGQKSK